MDFPFDRQPPVHMPLAYGEVELTKKTDKGRFQKRKRTVEGKEEEEEEEEQEMEVEESDKSSEKSSSTCYICHQVHIRCIMCVHMQGFIRGGGGGWRGDIPP